METIPYSSSDHFPIYLTVEREVTPKKIPFRVEQMWFKDENLIEQLELWWNNTKIEGSRMFKIVQKLKMIKVKLIQWNKHHFVNIS